MKTRRARGWLAVAAALVVLLLTCWAAFGPRSEWQPLGRAQERLGPEGEPTAVELENPAAETVPGRTPVEERGTPADPAPREAAPPAVAPAAVYVQVLEADSRVPVDGAAAFERLEASYPALLDYQPLQPPEAGATSDARGLLRLDGGLARGTELQVHRAGFGPAFFDIEYASADEALAPPILLTRGAVLTLRAREASGAPIAGVELSVGVERRHLQQPQAGTFFANKQIRWWAVTDAAGVCVLRDLPAEVPLVRSVTPAGAETAAGRGALHLAPGEEREEEFVIGAGHRVAGRVVDQGGAPVDDCALWLVPARAPRPVFFPRHRPGKREQRSDAGGSFVFEDVPDGDWHVGIAPGGGFAALAEFVRLNPDSVRRELVLVASAGLHIRGRVEDASGATVEGARVFARSATHGWVFDVRVEGDAFEVGPLLPGEYTVSGHEGGSGPLRSSAMAARAGDEDLRIVLLQPASVTVRIVDAQDGRPTRGRLRILDFADGNAVLATDTSPGGSSEYDLNDLLPGRYSAVATARDGRVGVAELVVSQPGEELAALEVRVAPGAKLTVRSSLDAGIVDVRLWLDGAPFAREELSPLGELSVVCPPGTIEVVASFAAGERRETISLVAGQSEKLDVR